MTGFNEEKRYEISRNPDGRVRCEVIITNGAGERRHQYKLAHLVHHSPTGFEVGYEGSGPADLALSILRDFFGEQATRIEPGSDLLCWRYHQAFKSDIIAGLSDEEPTHVLTYRRILAWIGSRSTGRQVLPATRDAVEALEADKNNDSN